MLIDVVEPHQVSVVWGFVKRHIEAAQRRGPTDFELDELRYTCMNSQSWRLLVLEHGDAAAIIRILNDRLHVVSLGGKLPNGWERLMCDWLCTTAAYLELKGITLCGRKAWTRVLAPLGFKPIGGGWLEKKL